MRYLFIFITIVVGKVRFISSMAMEGLNKRARDSLAEIDEKGRFVRTESRFRNIISTDHPVYKPEANRYHLYVSYACPWANR